MAGCSRRNGDLAAGRHEFVGARPSKQIPLLWARAWQKGYSPFKQPNHYEGISTLDLVSAQAGNTSRRGLGGFAQECAIRGRAVIWINLLLTPRVLEPEGEDTFGVADFTAAVANLKVIQLSAVGDWMNNTDWIKTLKTPHRLYELQHSNHDFNGADDALQEVLRAGIKWILNFG